METRNGWTHRATATEKGGGRSDSILTTKGVTVAFAHPTPRETPWRCADADPELFDPVDDDVLAEARDFCGGCVTRTLCLDLGVRRGEWGVWGGVLLEDGKPLEKVRRRGRPPKVAA